jgi:hypothetical protein
VGWRATRPRAAPARRHLQVAARLLAAGARGRCLTLKVKRRQAGAPEPAKFLGHGVCDNISRSITLGSYIHAKQVCGGGEGGGRWRSCVAPGRAPAVQEAAAAGARR